MKFCILIRFRRVTLLRNHPAADDVKSPKYTGKYAKSVIILQITSRIMYISKKRALCTRFESKKRNCFRIIPLFTYFAVNLVYFKASCWFLKNPCKEFPQNGEFRRVKSL